MLNLRPPSDGLPREAPLEWHVCEQAEDSLVEIVMGFVVRHLYGNRASVKPVCQWLFEPQRPSMAGRDHQ